MHKIYAYVYIGNRLKEKTYSQQQYCYYTIHTSSNIIHKLMQYSFDTYLRMHNSELPCSDRSLVASMQQHSHTHTCTQIVIYTSKIYTHSYTYTRILSSQHIHHIYIYCTYPGRTAGHRYAQHYTYAPP